MSKVRRNKSLNETDLDQEKYLSAAIHINPLKKDDVLTRFQLSETTAKPKQFTHRSKRILPPKKPPPLTFETRAVSTQKFNVPNNKEVQQHLDDASHELNIGNVQLKQIKQLINTSSSGPKKVNKVVSGQPLRKDYSEVAFEKRNKFLLTLNNVQERMQQIQHKFFNGQNVRYKSVKHFYGKKTSTFDNQTGEDFKKKVNEDATSNERQIMNMAKQALARRKAMLECESGASRTEEPISLKQTAFQASLMKSEYLKKEFQKRAGEMDAKTNNNVSIDENFLGKLENSFASRPFGKVQPGKSYWSAFNPLKDTLYDVE